jgi:rhomboid family GlyGly-CTERM serine protease
LKAPGAAWAALAVAAALASVLALAWPANLIDWQPGEAAREPWRSVTAAFVHWSPMHLWANVAGAAVVAAFGWAARAPLSMVLAWALAWPLTHAALLLRPELLHYGGLSGVMHAGTAIGVTWLLLGPREALPRGSRWIGAGVGVATLLKIALEAPWGPVLRTSDEWDIAIAPLAHATGVAAGVLCAVVVLGTRAALSRPPQSAG